MPLLPLLLSRARRLMPRGSRIIAAAIAAALITACSPPPDLSALQAPPGPGKARLTVLYPAPLVGSNGAVRIKFNASQSCDLQAGHYLTGEIPPGDDDLLFSFCGMPGTSPFHLKAAAGEKYYLRILPYDSSFRGIISGYPSEFVPPKAPAHAGPLAIERLDEATALEALRSLKPGKW